MSFLHSTTKGRVVYNRKVHLFTTKDLLRISSNVKSPGDVDEAFGNLLIIWGIFVRYLQAWLKLLGFSGFYHAAGWLRGAFSDIWNVLRQEISMPDEIVAIGIIKKTKLQGGLSTLDLY